MFKINFSFPIDDTLSDKLQPTISIYAGRELEFRQPVLVAR